MDLSIMKPVLVQVGLTFVMLFWMAKERLAAVRAGTVVRNEPGVRPTWPGRAGTISNAFHNLLEMPMLFYAAVAFALLTNAVTPMLVALAWAYVGARIVHAAIFTTYNNIPHRFIAYLVSNFILATMWVLIGAHVMTAA